MNFIQTRISGGGSCLEKDTQCLEDVRSRWCSLLGENYIVDEHSTLLSDAIRIVLEPPPELCPRVPRVLENLSEDISPKNNLELREQYRRILHLSSELKASASTN
ncbi:Ubiquitin specific peptidase 25 [Caligus rogercresseyi]|uniref:Ubiquitin specific peptidase 25 n=1 Tax=Caligus rogercresseyi TaxID=217165 RepID=A0A7T8QV04_CALRO|nr:Ubiquitin specific peptidase 25 [Caligus rogercresseyi]